MGITHKLRETRKKLTLKKRVQKRIDNWGGKVIKIRPERRVKGIGPSLAHSDHRAVVSWGLAKAEVEKTKCIGGKAQKRTQ